MNAPVNNFKLTPPEPVPCILDACCGGRMMWFDKQSPLVVYHDKRRELVVWKRDPEGNKLRSLNIDPDVMGNFTEICFPDDTFRLVVFDPPHFLSFGEASRSAKNYGRLFSDWETEISAGFAECFRVLKSYGTLIFKWNSTEIPLKDVLALSPFKPLFGHTTGRQAKTYWAAFMKAKEFARS